MWAYPLRLLPGQDLRRGLEEALSAQGALAGFVLSGMGSLRPTVLRLSGAETTMTIDDDVELLTLAGSLGQGGPGGPSGQDGQGGQGGQGGHSHLHASVALPDGRVLGGHLAYGCQVRTTAEVLLALLPGWQFTREVDPGTGWAELVVQRLP